MPYIPAGMPYGEAETILRGAGFNVAQQAGPQGAAPGETDLHGGIDPFMPPLLCRTSVEVLLRPAAATDYRVAALSARFASVCPAPGHG